MKSVTSRGTRIDGDELFKYDKEVEPILSVLCNKLMEQSRMEVLEEEELRVIREQQGHFEKLKHAATLEAQRLENEEQQRQMEIV